MSRLSGEDVFMKRENEILYDSGDESDNASDVRTIAAISTAMAPAGIGIVRVSGTGAVGIVDSCFSGTKRLADAGTHSVIYGHVYEDGQVLDEVLVSVFLAPNSYTGEDVVEVSAHGGVYVLRRILDVIIKSGAVLAGPGEFTKRRFLNGKMDLSQAEAVMDIISSENESLLKNSQNQLSGVLSGKIRDLREKILYETSFIEAALDDPEHYDLNGYPQKLYGYVDSWKSQIDTLVEKCNEGLLLRDGIKTVILGAPNAGKSSLLNLMAQTDRAIVSDIPGTTRDTLEEKISLGDFSLRVIDTAGIRSKAGEIEQMGIDRALREAGSADLILFVVDGSVDYSVDTVDSFRKAAVLNIPLIPVINKSDLGIAADPGKLGLSVDMSGFTNSTVTGPPIVMSARLGSGLDELRKRILDLFFEGDISMGESFYVTNLRHKEALTEASASLSLVLGSISDGMPEDFFTVDLMDAYTALGRILGESLEEDLVDKIFSEFCMGK